MKTACYTSTPCRPTRIQVSGGTWPTQIWGSFMGRALAGTPVASFNVPEDSNLIAITVDTRYGCVANSSTPSEYLGTSYFLPGTEPSACAFTPPDDGKGKDKDDDKPGRGRGRDRGGDDD
jgi:membrane carboxypeptidase/penicillin-binding protein